MIQSADRHVGCLCFQLARKHVPPAERVFIAARPKFENLGDQYHGAAGIKPAKREKFPQLAAGARYDPSAARFTSDFSTRGDDGVPTYLLPQRIKTGHEGKRKKTTETARTREGTAARRVMEFLLLENFRDPCLDFLFLRESFEDDGAQDGSGIPLSIFLQLLANFRPKFSPTLVPFRQMKETLRTLLRRMRGI